MFGSLLIANRGEIACRIMATARRLGLRTVAVYSDADADARHVRLADQAVRIGPAQARESYLSIPALLQAARESGAEAVHPGYGFLSENAAFAEACLEAGLVWVGPPPAAIRAMGSKSEAKALMQAAGVPLVPGYHGEDQDPERLAKEAAAVGFPLLIKASAGGGGKGMRVVTGAAEFAGQLESAQREAAAAFGDARVLLERYLQRPRHVELQVFADRHGNVIHLFERDCSIQRRHQKVVEEAPAPNLPGSMRQAMGEAAVAAARAIGYEGAGTIEFIVEDERFHFMEMNTRLQVEHPVTEAVTGLDLVEWQLRVAAGEPLPRRQEDLVCRGHAIEVRLYAEDPARDFAPATGTIECLDFPAGLDGLRIDAGVETGDRVSVFYDPMIAKIIVAGTDRTHAVGLLRRALAGTRLLGLPNNLSFLKAIADHPAFAAADLDTGFIPRHAEALAAAAAPDRGTLLPLAALAVVLRERAAARALAAAGADPASPWAAGDGWRAGFDHRRTLSFAVGAETVEVPLRYAGDGLVVDLPDGPREVAGRLTDEGALTARVGERAVEARVAGAGTLFWLAWEGGGARLELEDPVARRALDADAGGQMTAPMPGRIVAVRAKAGDAVEAGAPLVVLEAMKMEHTIRAPAAGLVKSLNVEAGLLVEEGAILVEFEAAES